MHLRMRKQFKLQF